MTDNSDFPRDAKTATVDAVAAGDGDGQENGGGWRERCIILEESLTRFRQQATKIRNTLGQQVSDMLTNP
jgi:hypothetical protein